MWCDPFPSGSRNGQNQARSRFIVFLHRPVKDGKGLHQRGGLLHRSARLRKEESPLFTPQPQIEPDIDNIKYPARNDRDGINRPFLAVDQPGACVASVERFGFFTDREGGEEFFSALPPN